MLEYQLPRALSQVNKTRRKLRKEILIMEKKIELLQKETSMNIEISNIDKNISQEKYLKEIQKVVSENLDIRTNDETNIDFQTFMSVEKKVEICKVIFAARVPKKDKLIYLLIQTKDGFRSAITNLGEVFIPEDFLYNQFGFVMNLKPVKIGGLESQAMITCMNVPGVGVRLLKYNDEIIGTEIL